MNKNRVIRNKSGTQWIGLFQTCISIKRYFYLSWRFIDERKNLMFELLYGIVSFRFYTWNEKPACYVSFRILWMQYLDFRIGNSKTWFYIRCENYYAWRISKENKLPFD